METQATALTTVVISPRDRYSGLLECIEELYRCTPQPFELWVLDLDYPAEQMEPVRRLLDGRDGTRIFPMGLITPMDALREVRDQLHTPSVVLLDNDSRVTPGWLPPLVAAMETGATVVSPLVLEREGVDDGAELRNHLHRGEIRVVEHAGTRYLIEHKSHRRTPLEQIPRDQSSTQTFELHCVLFASDTFKQIELPSMVVREHLDIALQVLLRGERMLVEPASQVIFDNLGTRMNMADMRFFFYRWQRRLTMQSANLFERRWGYRFYSEQAMYNWVFRRKTFLLARWLGLPIRLSNRVTSVAKRVFCTDFDPLPNVDELARPLFDGGVPVQLEHAIR